jgi:glucose/arabinose dehydrogenase
MGIVALVGYQSLRGRGLKDKILAKFITPHPWVRTTRPAATEGNVDPATFIAADVVLPNTGHGVDQRTLSDRTVRLYRTDTHTPVEALRNTTGGGDAIVLQPVEALEPATSYTFEVTPDVRDTGGVSFRPYKTTFTTGHDRAMVDFPGGFEKVPLPATVGMPVIGLTVGPDDRLYGTTVDGRILRYDIFPDGTLGNTKVINTVQRANWGPRMIPGILFDKSSTKDNLIAWVSHAQFSFDTGEDWTGKISRLSGPNLEHYQDIVVNLPRSVRDHITATLGYGPDGAIYFCQPSNTAMGAPDRAWGRRNEHLLTAAILRLDPARISNPPLDVKTEDGGSFDPAKPGAPLTIYATGIRNAFSLLLHSNGSLYAPTNGSASGGNTPGYDGGTVGGFRFDAERGPYNLSPVEPLVGVAQTQNDYLYRVVKGGYYGHPNPHRNEYVLNGGNPTAGQDVAEVWSYPVGTQPDRNYRGFAYDLEKNVSPNGIIEYHGDAFGGALKGQILVTRYSGGKDILVLKPNPDGTIAGDLKGIVGFTQLVSPIGLVEHRATGNLYVAEFGAQRITLLRPMAPGPHAVASTSRLLFHTVLPHGRSNPAPLPQRVTVRNVGTELLDVEPNGLSLSGPDAGMFALVNPPKEKVSARQGRPCNFTVAFAPPPDAPAGVRTATLNVVTNDRSRPRVVVELRGLVTTPDANALAAASGNPAKVDAANIEPSLQRILDLYGLTVNVGDDDPTTSELPLSAVSTDEARAPLLEKVLPDPVTIEPLACFGPASSPVMSMYWYDPRTLGKASGPNLLFDVESVDNKAIRPRVTGIASFDPGDDAFGLLTIWPSLRDRAIYTQDARNTYQPDPARRKAVRFYRVNGADGLPVPNTYVFAIEAITDLADQQDFVGLIRNVRPVVTAR